MTKQINLYVNDISIQLDYFVAGYIDHTVRGILSSLRDTGEVESLELVMDNEGGITISLNECDVPLKEFPQEIIKRTILGMVSPLKGVEKEINKIKIKVKS